MALYEGADASTDDFMVIDYQHPHSYFPHCCFPTWPPGNSARHSLSSYADCRERPNTVNPVRRALRTKPKATLASQIGAVALVCSSCHTAMTRSRVRSRGPELSIT